MAYSTKQEIFVPLSEVKNWNKGKKYFDPSLTFPEIEKPDCYILSNETGEVEFFVRTDDKKNGAMLRPIENPPGFWVTVEITKEQILDIISFANIFDVSRDGKIELEVEDAIIKVELTEDYVLDAIDEKHRVFCLAYICLFGDGAIEQARAEHEAEISPKSFKEQMEALLNETETALAA